MPEAGVTNCIQHIWSHWWRHWHVTWHKQTVYLCLREEAEELASSLGLVLFTTSAKENVNIEPVFRNLAQALTPGKQGPR